MSLFKKIYHFVASIFLYSVFFIMVVIGLCVGLYFVDQYQSARSGVQRPPLFGAYVIISPSMEPNIHVRDAIVTMRKDENKIKKGDIITYISKDPSHYGIRITHRVIGIFDNDGGIAYRTKGDNNNVEDSKLVNHGDVLGKVMLRIPYIGYIQEFLTTIYGWILLIVCPCVYIIGSDIVKLIKKINNNDDDNNNSDSAENNENSDSPNDNLNDNNVKLENVLNSEDVQNVTYINNVDNTNNINDSLIVNSEVMINKNESDVEEL